MTARDRALLSVIVLVGIFALCVLFFASGAALSVVLFRRVIRRQREKTPHTPPPSLAPYDAMLREGIAWADGCSFEEIRIQSHDKLTLRGRYLGCKGSKKAVLMMHGYLCEPLCEFASGMRYFHEHGYHVLLPDQRGHSQSQGDYICFGVQERYDVQRWAHYLCDRLGEDCTVLLHGISMGATGILMASALPLPCQVVGLISDCGFTSPEAIMRYVMQKDFRLYGFPVMPFARYLGRKFARFDTAYSTCRALQECRIPVLFIHGSADSLVPLSMTLDNYNACRAEKRLMVVPHADHGCSYFSDPDAYGAAVEDFFRLCTR